MCCEKVVEMCPPNACKSGHMHHANPSRNPKLQNPSRKPMPQPRTETNAVTHMRKPMPHPARQLSVRQLNSSASKATRFLGNLSAPWTTGFGNCTFGNCVAACTPIELKCIHTNSSALKVTGFQRDSSAPWATGFGRMTGFGNCVS